MRNDPYAKFNFLFEADGLTVAGFTEVGGLTFESDVIEYREGSDPARMRKLPGLYKFANVNLKRGFTQDRQLYDWRKTSMDGATERKNCAVILLDEGRSPVARWNLYECWVMKLVAPALNATANEAAIEEMELVVEDMEFAE